VRFERAALLQKSVKKMPRVHVSSEFDSRLRERIRKEIDNPQSTIIPSFPVKPALATLTAAAAITAMAIVVEDQFFHSENDQPIIVPRLSAPPMPGSSHGAIPGIQPASQRNTGLAIGTLRDSTDTPGQNDLGQMEDQNLMKNLRDQARNAKTTIDPQDIKH
ncbi:hypothetical protein ACFL67_03775, partial [candidate division KSB1 bacterium]